jgi:hypothetical protein
MLSENSMDFSGAIRCAGGGMELDLNEKKGLKVNEEKNVKEYSENPWQKLCIHFRKQAFARFSFVFC